MHRSRQPRAVTQPRSRGFSSRHLRLLVLLILSGARILNAQNLCPPLTVDQLRDDPNLTPERFARYFRDFAFKFGDTRQAPEDFLALRSGDCEDYASLAAEVLRRRTYTTKLIAVFMDGQTHVVCYVQEAHCYLDYNRRAEPAPLQATDGTLEDMAGKVAASFRTDWRYAAEFTYCGDCPRFGRIAFR